jgi:glucose/arabinose dehydrogenase
VFAQGFYDGTRVAGRPVDVLELADGSLLVSDDLQGALYRISYLE